MINSLKNIKVKLWNFLSYLYLQELLNLIALMFKFSKKNNCVDLAETTLSIIGHDITDEILFPSAQKIKWLRPSEMCENPEFITKHNHFSVIKGESEGKSLLAGVSILIQDSYLFSKVVPEFNCFEGNSGMFVFRFWECGEWIEIVVDDRLPTINGNLIYLQSAHKNEFWPALLEKAYAKMHGSYEALNRKSVAEVLVDLTGGITENIDVKKMSNDIYNIIEEGFLRNSMISCFVDSKSSKHDFETTTGLMKDHCYCITDKQQFAFETETKIWFVPLLRIRDPWASDTKWNGNWSIGSEMWSFLSESMKQRIGLTLNHEGEFWISLIDFVKMFDRLEVCHLSPEHGNGKWVVKSHHFNFMDKIQLQKSHSCLEETIDTRIPKQKIHFTLDDNIEKTNDKFSVMISIIQKVAVCIKISIHKVQLNERKRICFISFNDDIYNCVRLKLTSGNYEITSESIEPIENRQFYLRIFIPTVIIMEEINSQAQEILINVNARNEMILPITEEINKNGVDLKNEGKEKLESANEQSKSKINDDTKQTKKRVKDKKMKTVKKEKMPQINNQLMRKHPVNCLIM